MSEYNIPFHIQEEIIKRLPVKSLIQFRSVSKAWKSLIDSSQFIAAHSLRRHTQQQHLLVLNDDSEEGTNCVSYIDDDTFPQQRSLPTLPLSVKQLKCPILVGSSHGLMCSYGSHPNFTTGIAVLWNPSIRKSIVVPVPGQPFVGFGVCPVTLDPKILSITQSTWDLRETNYQCEVMLYTLSSGKWKHLSSNLPTKYVRDVSGMVVTDRFIYWRAILPTQYMIMSFDVTNEIFEMIDLPDSFAYYHKQRGLYMSKLRDSLAMLQYNNDICSVWVMGDVIQRSFTKLFTIQDPEEKVLGFRKSGIPIMEVPNDDREHHKLVVCEPNTEQNNVLEIAGSHYSFDLQNNVLEIAGSPYSFDLCSYMETLLLLVRSDCTSY